MLYVLTFRQEESVVDMDIFAAFGWMEGWIDRCMSLLHICVYFLLFCLKYCCFQVINNIIHRDNDDSK